MTRLGCLQDSDNEAANAVITVAAASQPSPTPLPCTYHNRPAATTTSTPTSASMAAAAKLINLPPELRALIITQLTQPAARSLAVTASAALHDVLEARSDLKTFTLHRVLARSMARLTFSAAGNPRSKAVVPCSHEGATLSVHIPTHAVPQTCAEQQHAAACTPVDPALFWFSPAAIASAHKVVAAGDPTSWPFFTLPPGMTALTDVQVSGCSLGADWLPPSSSSYVRSLRIIDSVCNQLPLGMSSLSDLTLRDFVCLDGDDWLPESSCSSVQTLKICDSLVCSLPPGMCSLERLYLSECHNLITNWLPESSRQHVRVLSAGECSISAVPTGVPALQAVRLSGYHEGMLMDWLPASSRQRVRVLFVNHSYVSSIPDGMDALETVSVEGCDELAAEWLPASSSKRVETICATASSLQRLPADMGALSKIDVRGCRRLAADWLPASSATRLQELRADNSCMQRLPVSLSSLSAVRVPGLYARLDFQANMDRSRCVSFPRGLT